MMVPRDKATLKRQSSVAYAIWVKQRLQALKRKTALSELVQEYERETGARLSRRTYQRALKNVPGIRLERHEQFYAIPTRESDINSMYSLKSDTTTIETRSARIHSAHKIKLSMSYKGEQPTKGAIRVRPFGRYKTQLQSIYRLGPNITVVAFKHKLNAWIHNPPGARTQEQIIEAKKIGYMALIRFSKEHSLGLEGYLNRLLSSHHVIEHEKINEQLKPMFEKYGPDIEKRIGSKICPSSHKGKIEHEGTARPERIVQGSDVAKGLEYLVLDYPNQFSEFARENVKLTENMRLHLGVLGEMRDAIRELREEIKRLRK